jgi:hypothetical protein
VSEGAMLQKGVLGLSQTTAASIGNVVCSTTLIMVCYGFAEAGPASILSMTGAGKVSSTNLSKRKREVTYNNGKN